MGKNKNAAKPKSTKETSVDNDQLGENSSGYGKQDEIYKKKKTK